MEAYLRTGADLITAVQKVDESIGLSVAEPAPGGDPAPVPSAADNDRALAELQKIMGGVA